MSILINRRQIGRGILQRYTTDDNIEEIPPFMMNRAFTSNDKVEIKSFNSNGEKTFHKLEFNPSLVLILIVENDIIKEVDDSNVEISTNGFYVTCGIGVFSYVALY